jgi:toxin ParE1/3/4
MSKYTLSSKADKDITEIYQYSYERFGYMQADSYLQGLEDKFRHLADQPFVGRQIDHIRKGYFRYEYESHSIFYKQTENGIIIMRVLHRGRDMFRHV